MKQYMYLTLIVFVSIAVTCFADWTPYTDLNSPLETDYISSLDISPEGKILIGSHSGGLYVKAGDNWDQFNQDSTKVPINFVNGVRYSGDTLFVGSASGDLDNLPFGEGLSFMNLADSSWSQLNMGLEINNIITGIEITPQYRAVSTYGGGLTIFNNDGWIRYQTNFRTEFTYADSQQNTFNVEPGTYMMSDYIRGLEYDTQNGILWLATLDGAVAYGDGFWQIYNVDNSGLPSNRIQLIKVDENSGAVYFGTYGFGLVQKIGDVWTVFNYNNSLIVSDFVFSLEVCPYNGDLWIGTDCGLNSVTSDSFWTFYLPPDSNLVFGNFYSDIAFDSSGNVWVAAFGGGIAYKYIQSEPEPEDTLFVDVKKLKFLITSPVRNDVVWLRANLEPIVDLIDEDSVSITIESSDIRLYSWEHLFDIFTHIFHFGNLDIYFAYADNSTMFLKCYNNQDKIKLYLLDWGQQIDLYKSTLDLDVRVKLGNYVGHDRVNIGPVNLATDPYTDTLDYEPGDILLSSEYYPTTCNIDDDREISSEPFVVPVNYPNPFNPVTRIDFYTAQPGLVNLTVYDILGRVSSIEEDYFGIGDHSFIWDGSMKASGVYFYTIRMEDRAYKGRMTLLK